MVGHQRVPLLLPSPTIAGGTAGAFCPEAVCGASPHLSGAAARGGIIGRCPSGELYCGIGDSKSWGLHHACRLLTAVINVIFPPLLPGLPSGFGLSNEVLIS